MKVYVAELLKKIKSANNHLEQLEDIETQSSTYLVSEKAKTKIPDYDIDKNDQNIMRIVLAITQAKHIANVFNTTTTILDGETIDAALVTIAILSGREKRYRAMSENIDGQITDSRYSRDVMVKKLNYDPAAALFLANGYRDQIEKIQLAIDQANITKEVEVPDDIWAALSE